MTPAENNLLLFLVRILHAELSDRECLPSRRELRHQLDALIEAKKTEELEAQVK